MLRVKDIAELLGCHQQTVLKLIRLGLLVAIDIAPGGAQPMWRIPEEEFEDYCRKRTSSQRKTTAAVSD